MKKYDRILMAALPVYLILAAALWLLFYGGDVEEQDISYKVEINQVMKGLEMEGSFSEPDLRKGDCIREVTFLPADTTSPEEIGNFYQNRNSMHMTVRPLTVCGDLIGYVRFDYVLGTEEGDIFYVMEGILFFLWLLLFVALWYIRQQIIRPFHMLHEIPCELARGNLQWEPEENQNRFFGKFVWGIGMLREELEKSRKCAWKLEKEKKMLLLSISHDIKIPLSAIKLNAKAIRDGIYGTEEERKHGAEQIEKHTLEIEAFVKEIVSTASEDIIAVEVENSEFYLQSYVEKIREYYEPKCRMLLTDFRIGEFDNKLLKGDGDKAFEVMENLMENALKYGDGKKIRIEFWEEDFCQVIGVFNSGGVVTDEEMVHLFDSFYRGSNVSGKDGNGLGLYISREIMKKMEGDIYAERKEEGMRFCLAFRTS